MFLFEKLIACLPLYAVQILKYTENDAKILFHTFLMLVYFFPVLGAIIADSFLGKFKTILYLSIVYAAGQLLLSLSAVGPLGLPARYLFCAKDSLKSLKIF